MQTVPQISISNALPVIFVPLIVIVVISAMKDFFEDYKRMQSDKTENNMKIEVYNKEKKTFEFMSWQELHPGHIIKVRRDKYLPADTVLLFSSEQKGVCYIETKNLDGETNLDLKFADQRIHKHIRSEENLHQDCLIINYEKPSPLIYIFNGYLTAKNNDKIPLGPDNIILRGCSLKNTEFIIGVVVYTGHQSKIMYNILTVKKKKTAVENLMEKFITKIFYIQCLLCLLCSSSYLIWYHNNRNSLKYLQILVSDDNYEDQPVYNFLIRFGNWVLIFTNFVPISLLVTLEMVKFIQGITMSQDEKIQYTSVQSSNLNEQLGQINHIFCDKTGTLTQNIMQFKQIAVGYTIYGEQNYEFCSPLSDEEINKYYPKVNNVDFRDRLFMNIIKSEDSPEYEKVIHILFLLASCHSVQTNFSSGNIFYTASSPDEYAIINFAKFSGVEFMGIDNEQNICVKFNQKEYKSKLLHNFEFDSTRKRQSIIIKDFNGKYFLFCKGADSVISNLRRNDTDDTLINCLHERLRNFGAQGLRTLMLADREIEENQYLEWVQKYNNAQNTLENKEIEIEMLQNELEMNLNILGATAIEDKLQYEVPETIEALKNSGIKIWVLTGDKIETAINIAYACNLLDDSLEKAIIDSEHENEVVKFLEETLENFKNIEKNYNNNYGNKNSFQKTLNCALVISGHSLIHITKPHIKILILNITKYCKCVLCCRVSPKQKQEVVTTIRENDKSAITLAIGDGANDVNMITASHVGIGIKGVEGNQAARASDYSINQFKDLRRLLFYHGRECYRRNSQLVCYNFFKNILLVLPQFWYGFTNWFSGQTLYNSFIYQLFNIFFSSLPVMVYAIYDQEYPDHVLTKNKKKNYYEQGLKNQLFNPKVFWVWFASAFIQGGVVVTISLYSLEQTFVTPDGHSQWFWASGTMIFGLIVVISNIKILIMSNEHSLGSLVINFGSMFSYLITWVVISNINTTEIYRTIGQMFLTVNFHLGNILAITATSFFDWALSLYQKWNYNSVTEIEKSLPLKYETNIQAKQYLLKAQACINVKANNKQGFILNSRKGKGSKYGNTGYAFNQIEKKKQIQNQQMV
ncbi:phospholipid-translocating p-type flippase family protein, putative [Ichthyophthirius multifiliis]|uniref:Phospholipid-transporting ATPase n=1 Tax=Ichthyophthirius multifiliis TaxID=5932 RepID=G0R413_ICHMU|nr:phospholipid-translocating p-type flippase family protein, putative [Ichthyophthirius multifiliis]EGR27787.1 phospholipid-translocating p-type flippase family protein, putative [Ichthyophthirius multifiliis]|eukprot:XP_004027132.1 phospholipid-translocating p-type flippase family protein, putative [Ichthyophthirius multifiliis]